MSLPITDSCIVAVAKLVDDAQSDCKREPSHSDLSFMINKAGLKNVDPKENGQTVGKAKRLKETLYWALENSPNQGSELISLVLSHVRAVGGFRVQSANFVGTDSIENAISAFDVEGFELSYDGSIRAKVLDNLSGKQLTEALLSYAQRAKKGVGDPALLAGTGKELLEATAKHVIHTKYGAHPQNANFPTLMGQAYSALQMSIPESNATPVSDNPVAEYEKAMFNMALAINRVRNKEGTGHGRISVTKLSDTEGENIVQMVGVIADFLLHRLSQDS
ncbi:abortive infection family protein [Vibrio cholerae]|uniref:Abortive infection protein-like C-terminal domain-containing protein n=4 Tax=Vibrio cholerae TaxID=666 RepID=Q9KMG2_VIBCH|nr:abortive infection family protein [Vibrio cholerae]EEY49396.1 hypothetical protein VIG_000605 [Vibrio cholerae INDRE 91/1]AAF96302.1 hypothetical protein VC_A0396 [Vibrio cholerae O1 biovar El Tor str. N16961]ABQ19227.1 hypothetical protein VC0395_0926 [Vibrio cholerae O395]ACP11186.1 hypothetical protein VC395_A0346 [Vibrio cholerae O395]AFC59892.1 hypothetical protein O3Y_15368 [Vibrio cholerae IEC224]